MSWKNYYIPWDEWVELCNKHGIDPRENCDLSFEHPGGGDGYTVVCNDDPPGVELPE